MLTVHIDNCRLPHGWSCVAVLGATNVNIRRCWLHVNWGLAKPVEAKLARRESVAVPTEVCVGEDCVGQVILPT